MLASRSRLRNRFCALPCLAVALLLGACGGGDTFTPSPVPEPMLEALFADVPTVHAKEASLTLGGTASPDDVERVTVRVRSRPGAVTAPVQITFARSWLERNAALDLVTDVVRVPVFGLYADYTNQVEIEVALTGGASQARAFEVDTSPLPLDVDPLDLHVELAGSGLATNFLLFQRRGSPVVVDVDGYMRWHLPAVPELAFPRHRTPDGLLVGAAATRDLYRSDWLGHVETGAIGDPRFTNSHHNFSPGPTGILNTAAFQDGMVNRPLSVLMEMTLDGDVLHSWDFDEILSDVIVAGGEDPAALIPSGVNWFHMNAAIYDASSDAVIVSSRHNFVIKCDHATGAVKWILGSPEKDWFVDYPLSLQPLALTVIGDPPIGQHALSVSADGKTLMLFNNGFGRPGMPATSRTYSKVSRYVIDEDARTAEEVWSLDLGESLFAPVCSSAYSTRSGDVLALWASPDDGSDPLVVVATEAKDILFSARVTGGDCQTSYAVEEIPLEDLLLE